MDQDEILLDAEERMEKAVNVLMNALKGIRTGRANPGLVDSVRVEYYGSPTPLKQIANISCPEPQQILIRPFDTTTLDNIARAIIAVAWSSRANTAVTCTLRINEVKLQFDGNRRGQAVGGKTIGDKAQNMARVKIVGRSI